MKEATLVFVSKTDNFAQLYDAIVQYKRIIVREAKSYLPTLIDERAALALIDGAHDDWQRLTLAGKSNAATRRMPVCLISDDSEIRAKAVESGADLTLGWAELPGQISRIVDELARFPDDEVLRLLGCECGGELPPLAKEGVEQFNRGEYYRQHDLFEEQWMQTAGPVRDLYRAVLQVGVAYYQIERGNYRGALKMLQRSVQWLYLLPVICQGIDVAQLRRDSFAARAELQRLGPERLDDFDRRLLKGLSLKPPHSAKT